MIYRKNNFVDTSQILNNYNPYRLDNRGPLILQPRFAHKNVKNTEVKQTEFPNYVQREIKTVDSFAEIIGKTIKEIFGEFLANWEESLSRLIDFTKEEVNSSIEKPTGSSVFNTLIYLFGIYQLRPDLYPDLAMSGDGGIYIEFQFDDKFVSIQVDSESVEKDRVYIEKGNQFGSVKLTDESIKEVFTK